jgi:hypothetical protein
MSEMPKYLFGHEERRRSRVKKNKAMNKVTRRTLRQACEMARLPEPGSARDLSETYLALLLAGVDHRAVGSAAWERAILFDAPRESSPADRRP